MISVLIWRYYWYNLIKDIFLNANNQNFNSYLKIIGSYLFKDGIIRKNLLRLFIKNMKNG